MKVFLAVAVLLATMVNLVGCTTTAANQRYGSPIPVYVDLNSASPAKTLK